MLLKLIIDYIKDDEAKDAEYVGIGLVLAYCCNEMFERFGSLHKNLRKSVNGQKAKNLVRALIFQKITTISSATNKDFAEGQILGLISTDANKADDIFNLLSLLVTLPLQLIATLLVLWYYFGWALLSAFIFTVFALKAN